MRTAPSTKNTAHRPRIALSGTRGTYRVESRTQPGVHYTTSAASCSCPARKPCWHSAAAKRLNVAFYAPKAPKRPAGMAALQECFS